MTTFRSTPGPLYGFFLDVQVGDFKPYGGEYNSTGAISHWGSTLLGFGIKISFTGNPTITFGILSLLFRS